ncbi:MAG: MBL fold metallo-hydrolase [Chloroflexota bacterium]|nr:MBL fold metallo-hydrolase [Chloroflexota bacterium]
MSTIDITWLGHSCFSIKGRDATLITDPYGDSIGYALGTPAANIVTSSHAHPGHGFTTGVEGNPKVIHGPGEYEVCGVLIRGISTFHDAEGGAARGKNTAYVIEMDEVVVCHLGDLGHALSSAQVEEMSGAEVLMVPVGGVSTIDASAAAETVRVLQPRVVIPMHFHTPALRFALDPVDGFLKEMGVKADVPPQQRLSLTRSGLPEETRVVLLDYRG